MEVRVDRFGAWSITGLNEEPNRGDGWKTWNLLRNLKDNSNLPWCIVGDMTNIVSCEDKRGDLPYLDALITGFNQENTDYRLLIWK